MPITFERFKHTMETLVDNWHMQKELDQIYRKYRRGTDMPDSVLEDVVVALLEEILHDRETGWISYWLYELDCGKNYRPGSVTEADGILIPLESLEDLWNLLVRNYKDHHGVEETK